MFKKALISTSDKTGLLELAVELERVGCQIVSTGGTAEFLKKGGIRVTQVAEETGFPEVMDGRVRTLHPRVHMGILARTEKSEDMDLLREHRLDPYDLIVVNLYPFAQALAENLSEDELIENIDIGGPTLLRAAAKNFSRITVICEPSDYSWLQKKLIQSESISRAERQGLAARVFSHVSAYDSLIAKTFSAPESNSSPDTLPADFRACKLVAELRYGENPHQKASWFQCSKHGLHNAEIIHGKALSYNNLLDLDAAVAAVAAISDIAAVAVKHTNPCGVAIGKDAAEAVEKCLRSDPVSIFGGIVAVNSRINEEAASHLSRLFLECIIAPSFSNEALQILQKKKDLRLLSLPSIRESSAQFGMRSIRGGLLIQTQDQVEKDNMQQWKFLREKPPTQVMQDISLAWTVCAHLKSNAIAIASGGQTLGLGMGQVNRVDAVNQAIERMKKHHQDKRDIVLASDAFFPFPDSIQLLAQASIKWVVQPGGSIRDGEVFAEAEKLGVNLIITGQRHFRH